MIHHSLSDNFRKDASLDQLAELMNVAQFVSFSPGHDGKQEFSRVLGFAANHVFGSMFEAVEVLLARSTNHSVNVRSFRPDDPRSHEFVYGLTNVSDAEATAKRILLGGFHIIVNETIDVSDGGVSGVLQGGTIEFSPDDTPRCVEKAGTASLPRAWGERILETVYGFPLDLKMGDDYRVEFSAHPRPCGWRNTHVLGWELEKTDHREILPAIKWPNNFSRVVGDKAFGLLIAYEAGLRVPKTTVISRRIAPFSFGDDTGSAERWIRTCPKEQMPGKYTTNHGWLDPFRLMNMEDPTNKNISSLLAQYAVRAAYSGALIVDALGQPIVEGTQGEGEALMLGTAKPEALPEQIVTDVLDLYSTASLHLGAVRFEWVHDGENAWIVQLHRGATSTLANVIVPGDATKWRRFDISLGLPALRDELNTFEPDEGILIVGHVGLTSHVADVLRKSNRPARLV
jgi:hypothetical protein